MRTNKLVLTSNMSSFLSQGSFGKEIFRKVAEEVSFRRLNTGNGMCKVGLEVEFKGGQDCDITGRKKMDLSDPRIKRFLFPFKVKIEIKITIKF